MNSAEAKEVGGRRRCGDGTFAAPKQRGQVVGVGFGGTLTNVEAIGDRGVVQDGAGKFEFGIVKSPSWVGPGD